MRRARTLLFAVALLLPAAAAAEAPAVARPSFPIDGEIQSRGLVFFIEAPTASGAAAVGTAHTFDLRKVVGVRRGELRLGHTRQLAARTSGFLVPPGRPFNAPGAQLADDFVIYALDAAPEGVRLLQLDAAAPRSGARVRILGVPAKLPRDEDELFGRVLEVSPQRIEVELDVAHGLENWGGAPVLDAPTGRVIGILQAHLPRGDTVRLIVSPVATLRDALTDPLEGGHGRAFAGFAKEVRRSAGAPERGDGPILRNSFEESTRVLVEIDYPPEGAAIGDGACGAFVAGRAVALHGELQQFDVILVIDTSRSTVDPTGSDVNGNGVVGKPYLGGIGSIFEMGSTDPGDSILAAEIAAARQLLHGLDPRSTRVGLVAFAGDAPDVQGGLFSRAPRPPAFTVEALGRDYARVEQGMDQLLSRGSQGSTHMAAGLDQATIELMGLRGALSRPNAKAEKIVLFFTDGQPTLPYGPGFEADNVRAVLRAANRADRAGIRIHSFAIGPDALEGPVATVEMAQRTDGFFTPVRHPGDLVDVVEEVSFANLESVELASLTTKQPADMFRTAADGSWAGFVQLEPGENRIRAHARASDGSEAERVLRLEMRDDAPDPVLPPRLAAARNRLLEECLRSLKEVRMQAERERADQVRRELLVEIDKERAAARQRAEEQRKQLELGVDEEEQP